LDFIAHPDNAGIRRAAIPSFDVSTDEDVISRRLVEILNASDKIRPLDKEMRSTLPTAKDVNGYIELRWGAANHWWSEHKTVFFVSSDHRPRYDVVLGRDSTKLLQQP
jgi:hypothetical protein